MKEQGGTEDIFEQEWREAFDGVEQAPPRIVWSEIDRTLAHEKAFLYRKKSIYYRWAAAAIFLLATSIGLIQLAGDRVGIGKTIASIDINSPAPLDDATLDFFELAGLGGSNSGVTPPPSSKGELLAAAAGGNGRSQKSAYNFLTGSYPEKLKKDEIREEPIAMRNHEVAVLELDALKPQIELQEIDLVDHLYNVPNYGFRRTRRSKSKETKYWAGLDFSSNSFDPNFQSSAGGLVDNSLAFNSTARFSALHTEQLDASSPTVNESMQTGQSRAFGFNLGVQLSEKWSVQSGLQYMKAQATNTTNVVVASTKLLDPIAVTSQIKNVSQVRSVIQADEVVEYNYQDVDLQNEFQFASIPIEAGYKILDNRFSLAVKAGLAANLYLGNKLRDPDRKIADVTIGPGSNSPYKELSFTGLAGLQMSYEFVNRFNLIIEPNYRRSIDNVTKSSSEFVFAPSGFGLQTGIRYEFN
ncbi:MAG: outer membrane beta-barrel protein [Cyclobacteriaceae bacterium]